MKDSKGLTAFHLAAQRGHFAIVDMIMKNSILLNSMNTSMIDFNARDNAGQTAFQYACYYGYYEVAEVIIMFSTQLGNRVASTSNKPVT